MSNDEASAVEGRTMRRVDPDLAEKFRKNPADEEFLESLNSVLANHEAPEYRDLPETHPTLLIVGVPRSGTTLLSQLVSAHLKVGYINNLIASFWRAPLTGIRLSNKLLGGFRDTSFASEFGRTSQLWEPHEFGYFWADHLQRCDMSAPDPTLPTSIDWGRLRTVLNNMCATFGAPMVFKSMLPGWYLQELSQLMKRVVVVRIRRDPVDNAFSLLKLRQEYNGSVNSWGAIRPLEYQWLQHESLEDQLVGQVYFIEKAHSKGLATIQSDRVLEVTYDEVCSAPHTVLASISRLLNRNGGSVTTTGMPPATFTKSISPHGNEDLRQNIESARDRFYNNSNDASILNTTLE